MRRSDYEPPTGKLPVIIGARLAHAEETAVNPWRFGFHPHV
jgi:hypothetical protein